MGFLDKAKAAATDLAAKADTALASSGLGGPGGVGGGDAEKYLRDLGVLAYLDATGRESSSADRERVLGALRELESRGALSSPALRTSPPPPPGGAARTGGSSGAAGVGGSSGAGGGPSAPPPPSSGGSPSSGAPTPPPAAPPPPSWMSGGGDAKG